MFGQQTRAFRAGHLTIKMSGHPPFGAQVMLNGHEYVACQARKAGVGFTKQDNCFTTIDNAAELAQVADTLSQPETAGRLRQLCERWIYTACLCFALDLEEQEKSAFHYCYSVYQVEYSRNLLFQSGREMDQIFRALVDRSRQPLDLDRIKTIFGDKNRPHYDKRKKNPQRWGVVVETPAYDLTIFKVHYGKMRCPSKAQISELRLAQPSLDFRGIQKREPEIDVLTYKLQNVTPGFSEYGCWFAEKVHCCFKVARVFVAESLQRFISTFPEFKYSSLVLDPQELECIFQRHIFRIQHAMSGI